MSAGSKSKTAAGLATAWQLLDCLLRRFFQQALLEFFLALDAMARPRHRLQTLGVDLLATVDALTEAAFADTRKGVFHHLQKLALVVALMEQEFLVVRIRRLVGDVLRRIVIRRAAVLFGSRHRPPQVLQSRLQPFFEAFQ